MTAEQTRRAALVTGATSGIGLAVATELARQGIAVFLCARRAEQVAATVSRLREEGLEVDGAGCDVTSPDSVRQVVAAAVARYGPLDVLVNNAGRSGHGAVTEISHAEWCAVLDANLTGVFRLTREVLNAGGMLARGHGRIVTVSSLGGKHGVPFGTPYSAAKHAVIGLTKSLGLELAATGITVNAVCPGPVETPMADEVHEHFAAARGVTSEQIAAQINSRIPIGRFTRPDEVAAMVGYLVSEAAAPVTAQAVNICGGLGTY